MKTRIKRNALALMALGMFAAGCGVPQGASVLGSQDRKLKLQTTQEVLPSLRPQSQVSLSPAPTLKPELTAKRPTLKRQPKPELPWDFQVVHWRSGQDAEILLYLPKAASIHKEKSDAFEQRGLRETSETHVEYEISFARSAGPRSKMVVVYEGYEYRLKIEFEGR